MSTANGVNGSISASQRFKGDHPCPICKGTSDDPRGNGSRCFGFLSGDGQWAHCTREDHAGRAVFNPKTNSYQHKVKGPCPCHAEHSPADPGTTNGKPKAKSRGTIAAVYQYRRTDAEPVDFEAVRMKDPKGFFQRRRGPDGQWVHKNIFAQSDPFLYRRPELLAAAPERVVLIVEGEKDVDNLRARGYTATCNPMGEGKWRDAYSEDLRGRRVAIIPDNDRVGHAHSQQVARSVWGKAAAVRIVPIPGLAEKGDVSDFFAAGGTVEELNRLIQEASPWEPDKQPVAQTAEPSTNGDGSGPHVSPAGTADSPPGRYIKANDDPHRLARLYLDKHFQHFDGTKLIPKLAHHRDEFQRWDGSAYKVYRDVEADLIGVTEDEFNRLNALAVEKAVKAARAAGATECPDENELPKAMKVTSGVVKNTLAALKSETCVSWDESAPLWLDDDGSRPDPLEVLPARNGLVDLSTQKVMRHTPLFFSPFCLDYDFVPDAKPAERWIKFLDELFPGDDEAIRELQKWFGYALTPDTSQHKILLMCGPPRSGKGTISRVLTKLIGTNNICNPTLASMTTNFGLQAFLGKFVAIIGDARVSGSSSDKSIIIERLLNISGEDDITIDRKYKDQLTTKLKTRVMIFSNDPPNFRDASTALVNRFTPFKLTQSWLGREDLKLSEVLYAELPGILKWAIQGRELLKEDGKFFVPSSGQALFDELKELTSPIMSFVDECCNLLPADTRDSGDLTLRRDLYHAWVEWCKETGHESGSDGIFGRNLYSAYPALKVERPRIKADGTKPDTWETEVGDGDTRPRRYRGIQLNGRGETLRQWGSTRIMSRSGPG